MKTAKVPNIVNLDFNGGAALVFTEPPTSPAPTTEAPTTIPPNLNHPVFSEDFSYVWTIPENTPVGTLVAVVSATDWDEGEAGELKYSLNPGNIAEFTIDGNTGKI